MRHIFTQTPEERRATLTALNIFFGALLGALLGSLSTVPIGKFILLVFLLMGAVTALFTIAFVKERRSVALSAVSFLAMIGILWFSPNAVPASIRGEAERIVATLLVWLLALVVMRLAPLRGDGRDAAGANALE
jgi:uncharacterized membrane protein YccC